MPKSSEQYQPSQKEIEKAETMMSTEEREMTESRELLSKANDYEVLLIKTIQHDKEIIKEVLLGSNLDSEIKQVLSKISETPLTEFKDSKNLELLTNALYNNPEILFRVLHRGGTTPRLIGMVAKKLNFPTGVYISTEIHREKSGEEKSGAFRFWAEEPSEHKGHFDMTDNSDRILLDSYKSDVSQYQKVLDDLRYNSNLRLIQEKKFPATLDWLEGESHLYRFKPPKPELEE